MWTADDKFFGASLATKLGVAHPKTVVLPNKDYVPGIVHEREPAEPRVPARLGGASSSTSGCRASSRTRTAAAGGTSTSATRSTSCIHHYDGSGLLTMIVQEFIEWEQFVRCMCLGQEDILPMQYDPRERKYIVEHELPRAGARGRGSSKDSLKLVRALGYDMNTVELAIRDGVPYAIDFMNPAPDMDINSLTPTYFEWAVTHMADMVIRLAEEADVAAGRARSKWSTPRSPADCALSARSACRRRSLALPRAADRRAWPPDSEARCSTDQLGRRGLVFGDRPLCTVLRPRFLTPATSTGCSSTRGRGCCCARSRRRYERAMADPTFRRSSGSPTGKRRSSRDDPALAEPEPDVAARRVLHRRRRGHMKLTEYNAETPAGAALRRRADRRRSTTCRSCARSRRRYERVAAAGPARRAARAARRLRGVARDGASCRGSPSSTGPRCPTLSEFVLFQRLLPRVGIECRHRRPARAASIATASCYGARRPRRSDLQARAASASWSSAAGSDTRWSGPCATRAVCMVNALPLQDAAQEGEPRGADATSGTRHLFTPEEQAAIAAHIPWTRVVEERTTELDGARGRPGAVRRRRAGAARAQAERRLRRHGHHPRLDGGRTRPGAGRGATRSPTPLRRAGAGRHSRRAVPQPGGRAACVVRRPDARHRTVRVLRRRTWTAA